MHIPDGFLDAKTSLATAALSAGGLAIAIRHARKTLPPRKVPLLGLAAAFLFVAQMINFPVLGGTSGHLVGATLAAALLGPSAAVIVVSTVLILQCFAFADGGVTALGANIFNMAIMGAVGGWFIFTAIARVMKTLRGRWIAAGLAAWASTVLASIVCAGELAASGTVPWRTVLPAMAGIHALIGIGEGLITAMVLSAIASVRPELLVPQPASQRSLRPILAYGLLILAGIALFLVPFASRLPDGLETVGARLGFEHSARTLAAAPAPDYQVPGLTGFSPAAALIGMIVLFPLMVFAGKLMLRGAGDPASDRDLPGPS